MDHLCLNNQTKFWFLILFTNIKIQKKTENYNSFFTNNPKEEKGQIIIME